MEHTKGLQAYIERSEYRERLGLPAKIEEEYVMLAQGEYNRNYYFVHPVTGRKLVLRVNFGSQMHLTHQIEYEYQSLKLLEDCGRTPRPFYVDGSQNGIPYGVMVMEYLPGRHLDYTTDLLLAAGCLADIHSVRIDGNHHLFAPENPLKAILKECEEMFSVYCSSPLSESGKKDKIRAMLDMGWKRVDSLGKSPYKCCINTELNSTNFLVEENEKGCYLVDWEKPLYGDPAQDLGHFLAPTTTFWKTDVLLDEEMIDEFIREYITKVGERFDTAGLRERIFTYIPVTCLRGITWCAMAWVEYQRPGKDIFNKSTYEKLKAYLEDGFLEKMRKMIDI